MLKTIFPTLTRFRFTIQILMLFVTVYGGALLGTYTVVAFHRLCLRWLAHSTSRPAITAF